jgi:hypothetical protein
VAFRVVAEVERLGLRQGEHIVKDRIPGAFLGSPGF